jgi:SAM-dependent methyltransferase
MKDHSFGEKKISRLDALIAYLRYRQLSPYLPAVTSLTDIGCGYNATFLQWAAKKFGIKKLAGIDLSISGQLLADPRYDLKISDLNSSLPGADASAELVTSLAVLEHLARPDNNLREIYRLLQPGGRLVLTTPAPRAKPLLEFLAFRLKLIDAAEIRDHKRYFSQADLSQILLAAGFSADKIITKSFMFGFNNLAVCLK